VALKDIIIQKKIRKSNRHVQFHNYESASTIGILYSIENKSDQERIKNYISTLNEIQKTVYSLGFIKKAEEIGTVYFGRNNHNYYSEKHISKTGKIKEVCVSDFIQNELDILINAGYSNNFFLEYVFALSKAKFKVSGIIDCRYSDLNINYNQNKGLDYFIDQVDHYLNTIQKARN
jgi:hypothetical protein